MFEFLALPVFLTFVVLLASIALFKLRARFANWPILYRVVLSALIASFAPTLFVAGHGGIPLPSITGFIIFITNMRMDALADLHLSVIGIGTPGTGIYLPPFLVCFVLILIVACTKFRNHSPAMKPSRPW